MQYQVPQFIDVEDKIFGPLTFKQFVYVAGGGGIALLFFTFLPLWLAAILSLPFVGLGAALAFYRINGQPFIVAIEHASMYLLGNKLYLWKQHPIETKTAAPLQMKESPSSVPKISESKLKDLAWSLNIKDREKLGVQTKAPTGFEV